MMPCNSSISTTAVGVVANRPSSFSLIGLPRNDAAPLGPAPPVPTSLTYARPPVRCVCIAVPVASCTAPQNPGPTRWFGRLRSDTRIRGQGIRLLHSAWPQRSRARLATVQASRAIPTLSPTRGAGDDVQARAPAIAVGLSRVGVVGVEKVVRIREELFFARFDCFVDLGGDQKGAHMSRFDEVVNEAIGEVVLGESPFRAETLAQHIAELVRARQGAERAEVTIAARYPEHKPAPVSGVQTQEIYTLHGRAVAFAHGTRRMVGVSATSITVCPCAQELVEPTARKRTGEQGYAPDQIDGILDSVPVATHNQRGIATLQI